MFLRIVTLEKLFAITYNIFAMEVSYPNEQMTLLGEEICREANKGEKPLFQIYKERIISKINYSPEKKSGTYTPPEAFEIAISTLSHNYSQSDFNFAIIVLYNTLGLNQENAVDGLRPFLSGSKNHMRLRNRLTSSSLAIAEDYLGLKRDTLYTPFTNKEWLSRQE